MSESGYFADAGNLPPISLPQADKNAKESLQSLLRRCSPQTVEAARRFLSTGHPKEIAPILRGVIARYVDEERRALLQSSHADSLCLTEQLGLDSLSLIEMSMTLEDVIGVTIKDDDLRRLKTIRDVEEYVRARLKSNASRST